MWGAGFQEITRDGEVFWEFTNPFYEFKERLELTNYVFRVHRYGLDYLGLKGKNFDPGRFEWVVKEKESLTWKR